MKYIVELTEDQMDTLREYASNGDAYDTLMRASLVPDDCLCAQGPVSDDLCPVHDADDLGLDDESDFDSNPKGK